MNIIDGGLRALSTYAFSEKEKNDRYLDYIGGIEIIDNESRVFFVEGLSKYGMA